MIDALALLYSKAFVSFKRALSANTFYSFCFFFFSFSFPQMNKGQAIYKQWEAVKLKTKADSAKEVRNQPLPSLLPSPSEAYGA